MKKTLLVSAYLLMGTLAISQTRQPPGPPTLEERLKRTNEMLVKEVQPSKAQQTAIETVFKSFFNEEDKLRKDNPPPPPPPVDPKAKAAMDKLVSDRDERIKKILTQAQYTRYMEVAKNMHPPHPGEKGKGGPPPVNR